MKYEVDVPWPLGIMPHKSLVAGRSLVLGIARQHGLQADTHTFHIVNRRPSCAVQQVETYDAVGVDVRVHRYRVGFVTDEDDFGSLDGIALGEGELQPICLIVV